MITNKSFAAGSIIAMLLISQAVASGIESTRGLRLHLPREVTVKGNLIRVGDVAVASGEEALVREVADISIGRISLATQKVVVDRYTMMTRLGSSGIDVSKVTLTGSDKVNVTMLRTSINSSELLAEAERFAMKFPLPVDKRLHALDMPADVNLPEASGKLEVTPRLAGKPGDDPLKVSLLISTGGKQVAVREVRFTPVQRSSRTVTAASPAVNPAIEADAPKVVFRNQPVVIEIEIPGLKVTAMGLPLEDGKAGQLIKVRNVDSKRDIIARVKADGTVAPIL